MRISRRSLLAGGAVGVGGLAAGAVGVEYDVLPGRRFAYDVLGLNGAAGVIPDVAPGPIERGVIGGANWWVTRPPGRDLDGLPLVIALHGAGGNAQAVIDNLGVDRFLAASGQQFAIAAIDGERSYWHPRTDGSDTGALVIEELLPVLSRRGLDTDRLAFTGWSMGGYGALLLPTRLPAPVPACAVSPAMWPSYDKSAPDAFDSQADFDQWGFGDGWPLDPQGYRIDCGHGDPFFRHDQDFAESAGIEFHAGAGGHDDDYWKRVLPGQLTWLGQQLAL